MMGRQSLRPPGPAVADKRLETSQLFPFSLSPAPPVILAFGFGSPWMLWGLLAAAIPIVIHLLRQRRPRTVQWAAMRFVRAAIQKRQRQIRIDSWLQVLIRGALLAALAMALAEPFLERFGLTAGSRSATHRILVVDSTFSMGYGSPGNRSFDRAKEVARTIVSSAGPGDPFNLARLTGTSPRVIVRRPAFEQGDLLEEIERLPLLEERGDLLATLRQILPLLRSADAAIRKEVIFVTDLQGETWLPASPALRSQSGELLREIAEAARLTIVDVGPETSENAAITRLSAARSVASPGTSIDLEVELRQFGRASRPGARLDVLVDGIVRHRETIDLPGSGTVTRPVRVPVENSADAAIEARLEDDLLPLDNTRRLVVPLRKSIRVLVVEGGESRQDESVFVELALAPPERASASPPVFQLQFVPTSIPISRLREQRLDEYDSVILCDVPSLTAEEADRLQSFVRGGGGLVISLGERADPDTYDRRPAGGPMTGEDVASGGDNSARDGLLAARFESASPPLAEQDLPFSISEPEGRHPITRPFEGNPDAGLLTTPLFRYRPVRLPLPPETRSVLKLSNGSPLVLERPFGAGRVVQIQTALNDRWGSWVVWPSFVPLMHEIVLYSVGGQAEQRSRLIGDSISRRWPASFLTGQPVMTRPGGERTTLTPSDGSDPRITFDGTNASGFYQLSFPLVSHPAERYAINPDTRESSLVRTTRETLEAELLPGAKFDVTSRWEPSRSGTERQEETRGRLVQPALLLVLLLLLADLALAGRRRESTPPY